MTEAPSPDGDSLPWQPALDGVGPGQMPPAGRQTWTASTGGAPFQIPPPAGRRPAPDRFGADILPTPGGVRSQIRQGLRTTILSLTLPVMFLILLAAIMLVARVTAEAQRESLATRARVTAELQAAALALPLWNLDVLQINALMDALQADPDFLRATVTDPDGTLLYRRGTAEGSAGRPVEGRASITYRSMTRSEPLGELRLELSGAAVDSVVNVQSRISLIAVALLAISLALILFLVLSALVFRPIRLLLAGISQIEAGSFERVRWTRRDEFGALVAAFNRFVDNLAVGAATRRALEASERELIQARAEEARADAASRAKSGFLANMSHELRTPLNAVIGYAEILVEEAVTLEQPELLPDLERILNASRHLLSLINDILDLSKVEAGRMEPLAENFDAVVLAMEVRSVAEPLATQNGNRLQLVMPMMAHPMHTDPTKLRQCLVNLVGNACKFTEHGVIALALTADRDADGNGLARFTVTDTGIGMSADQLERLFQPFTQADPSTTRRYGGTGLGLALTRGLAELLGGTISVTSALGQGSSFVLTIPDRYEPHLPPAPAVARSAPYRVLVIDDDSAVQQALAVGCADLPVELHAARDGGEGLRLARSLQPDLIMLDVILPRVDGWTVLSALRADPTLHLTPVVVLSMMEQRAMAIQLGAIDSIHKEAAITASAVGLIQRLSGGGTSGVLLLAAPATPARADLARALRHHGVATTEVVAGDEVAIALAKLRPGLVLLDIGATPDAAALARLLPPAAAGLPVILLADRAPTALESASLPTNVISTYPRDNVDIRTLMLLLAGRLERVGMGAAAQKPAAQSVG